MLKSARNLSQAHTPWHHWEFSTCLVFWSFPKDGLHLFFWKGECPWKGHIQGGGCGAGKGQEKCTFFTQKFYNSCWNYVGFFRSHFKVWIQNDLNMVRIQINACLLQNLDILRNVRLILSEFYTGWGKTSVSLPYNFSSLMKYFIEKMFVCVCVSVLWVIPAVLREVPELL